MTNAFVGHEHVDVRADFAGLGQHSIPNPRMSGGKRRQGRTNVRRVERELDSPAPARKLAQIGRKNEAHRHVRYPGLRAVVLRRAGLRAAVLRGAVLRAAVLRRTAFFAVPTIAVFTHTIGGNPSAISRHDAPPSLEP